ncbi:MAG TPA: winged helix-turn-helix domain-containing protein [Vicinamibacteria bacterium]|nr:winged helix-turn-helix domain-containing protein [Vicinamibacteria bacterium]
MATPAPHVVRFASFGLDLRSRELRREGSPVSVQDQPLRLLATLLERPGELVTREELHRRLWPSDTFVDFEHGLNAAVRRLRTALGDSAESPLFVETLPRRGYRFVAAVERDFPEGSATSAGLTRLLILPFRTLRPDPDTDFLALSVPDAVASALVGPRSLVVRSPIVGARYANEPLDLGRIAHEAEVDAVLAGTIVRVGERLRISTQLVRALGGAVLWCDSAEIAVRDLFQLQDEMVQRIVRSLAVELTAREQMDLKADVPADPRAYELYLRANRILLQGIRAGEELRSARQMYEQAVALDAGYAPAWAKLGRCHWLIGKGSERSAEHLERADACFRRALAINPKLLLAHSLHAQLEADLGRAVPAMTRLLGLAQSAPAAPELYVALVQVCRFCGQLEASIAADERARGLDPHVSTSANHTYWHLGDLDRAFAACTAGVFGLDAMILARWGRHAEAIALQREREATLPPTARLMAAAHRLFIEGSDREECLRVTEQALAGWPDAEGRYYLATNLARLGEEERALAELNRCLDDGLIHYRLLKRDPGVDPLRGRPAFEALLERSAARYRDACIAFADAGGQRLFGL